MTDPFAVLRAESHVERRPEENEKGQVRRICSCGWHGQWKHSLEIAEERCDARRKTS